MVKPVKARCDRGVAVRVIYNLYSPFYIAENP